MSNSSKLKFWHFIVAFAIAVVLMIAFSHWGNRLPQPLPFEDKIEIPFLWEQKFKDNISPNWEISQFGEIICVNNKGKLYTLDVSNGNKAKEIILSEEGNQVVLKIDHNNLYVIIDKKKLFTIDLQDNMVKDVITQDDKIFYEENIIHYNDYIVFWEDVGNITALNLSTGEVKNRLFFFTPIEYLNVYKNIIYYSENGFNVYALNLETLNNLWHYDIGHAKAHSNPVIIDDKIYLQVEEEIVVFDYLQGNIVDQIKMDVIDVFTDGVDLYANTPKYFIKINKKTGDNIWEHRGEVFVFDLLFEDEYIFYESVERPAFIKLDKETGKKIWEIDLQDYSFNIEKVVSTAKYDIIGRNDGYIYVLDKNTGQKLWRFNKIENPETLRWKVYNDKLIIFDGLDKFYAYDLN